MKLIAEEHLVSSSTISRVLRSTEIKASKKYLPRVLGIDEFKSLKSVDNIKIISEMLSKDLKDCPSCFRTSLKSLKNKKTVRIKCFNYKIYKC